uniref:GNAT family N-acetyltransferase n=1 Tax=Parerythrobacter lutipelagi TaxID=1964208 RepID=UPI00195DD3CD|nr:N-acetyltransferase [Parerythrobacter lutipelagi]
MKAIELRLETPGDQETIYALTGAAFRDMPFSDGDEAELVDKLRDAGDLALSLVALDSDRIVGHIAFSPVSITDGTCNWYGLGPVSVWPERQRQRIGSSLIEHGLAEIRARGARGVVLLGNPAFYSRFGFEHDPRLLYPGPPPEYFQRLIFAGASPQGTVSYPPAFG